MMRRFKLGAQEYELVAIAKDQSIQKLGKIAVYRVPNTQDYFTMPVSELSACVRNQNNQANSIVDIHEQISLFKQRFIIRTDVYANRYFSKKFNRKAYGPASPFVNGFPVRDKFLPLTNETLMHHLSGNNSSAIGIYPLSKQSTTKFLVFDIDEHHEKQPWKELTKSLIKECEKFKLHPLIEISQSGKGCHVWLFFETPVDAKVARQLGDLLLKLTQQSDPRMPFSAFDRMFPAQDKIDPGKVGNLIAAPLEGQALSHGKSLFVDYSFKPFEDQWQALADVQTINSNQLLKTINTIQDNSELLAEEFQNDESTLPKFQIDKSLSVTLKEAIYIKKSDLNRKEILKLKWLASFYNPEFFKLQSLRMPVNNTPRVITLFKEDDEYLILPRRLVDDLNEIVDDIEWTDDTTKGFQMKVKFHGNLYQNQIPAFNAINDFSMGILSARTGFGKTVIAAKMIAAKKVSTLILVPNKVLAEQWKEKLNHFLEITSDPVIVEYTPTGRKKLKKSIGTYYGQKKNPSGLVDIATIQAISKMEDPKKFLDRYGMVISDEVHHNAAFTYDEVINKISSRYLYGLSATPYRRDGQEPILTLRFGPIRYQTDMFDPKFLLTVKRTIIPRFTNFGMTDFNALNNSIVENRSAIQNDEIREGMLIKDIELCKKKQRHTIVLTSLVSHVDRLYDKLPHDHLYRIYGGLSSKERTKEIEKIHQDTEPYTILATPYVGGEGLDIASMDTMILAMPYSFHGNLEQYIGRLHRNLKNKSDLKIIDYVDMFVPMFLRMFRKRKQVYKKLGYELVEDKMTNQSGLKIYEVRQIFQPDSLNIIIS
ncbi:DEAD/DEAH box helicase [Companilactobacillus furfuricola]|uniref:DEAD/DEAH box helicase n=1 Tax=Companilactobacillus furfuricola TaxID=1462575 RepID=UPI000F770002|nr:DEAD/DEAH box helicase [Companilactobacillus furfuricola]